MLIKISNFEFTEVWDGVLYKKLSRYPAISDWEKRNIIEFVEYEAAHGRECTIECENPDILTEVNHALKTEKLTEMYPSGADHGMYCLPPSERLRDGIRLSYHVARECPEYFGVRQSTIGY